MKFLYVNCVDTYCVFNNDKVLVELCDNILFDTYCVFNNNKVLVELCDNILFNYRKSYNYYGKTYCDSFDLYKTNYKCYLNDVYMEFMIPGYFKNYNYGYIELVI
ncbi:hypothetical protein BCR36DRAFT_373299 [Piromyces finnis]|uniref:Uncharacterized protein n=1 Tax=Piromyces finnis TaxID=1754191 RepID=A0A1Y1V0F5_9FUNG|nr:hypothetical protein BCR36DRAFT_373299 [Piromyces finnis]|eukprot:ORX44549.1 hypothetical protein BCR36DRAFT_373299 [Piromyces finnis]